MIHSGDELCKDYSHLCNIMSARTCMIPINANHCKRSCGLCYDDKLPGLPPSHLPGKPLHTYLL